MSRAARARRTARLAASILLISNAAGPVQSATPLPIEELLFVGVPFVEETGEVQSTLRWRDDSSRPGDELTFDAETGVARRLQLGIEAAFWSGGEARWNALGLEALVALRRTERSEISLGAGIGYHAEGPTNDGRREVEGELTIHLFERRGRKGFFFELAVETEGERPSARFAAAATRSWKRWTVALEADVRAVQAASSAHLGPEVLLRLGRFQLSVGAAIGVAGEASGHRLAASLTVDF